MTCTRCVEGWAYCVVNWSGNERQAVKPCTCADGSTKRINNHGSFRTTVQYVRESNACEFLCGRCQRVHVHGEAGCPNAAPKDAVKLRQKIAKVEYVGRAPEAIEDIDVPI